MESVVSAVKAAVKPQYRKPASDLIEVEAAVGLLEILHGSALKPAVSNYFRFVNLSSRVRQVKWYLAATVFTVFLQQIMTWLIPADLLLSAFAVLIFGGALCAFLWCVQNFLLGQAGDPDAIFTEEETATTVNHVGKALHSALYTQATPYNQARIESCFIVHPDDQLGHQKQQVHNLTPPVQPSQPPPSHCVSIDMVSPDPPMMTTPPPVNTPSTASRILARAKQHQKKPHQRE